MIIRAKTKDLFDSGNLPEAQRENSKLNKFEIEDKILFSTIMNNTRT